MRVEYELSIVYILSWLKRQLSLDFNFCLFIIITIGFSSYDVCSLCADLQLKTTHSLKRSTVFAFVHLWSFFLLPLLSTQPLNGDGFWKCFRLSAVASTPRSSSRCCHNVVVGVEVIRCRAGSRGDEARILRRVNLSV